MINLALSSGCTCEAGTKPKQMVAKQSGKIISNSVENLNENLYRCQSKFDNSIQTQLLDNVKNEVKELGYHVDGNKLEYPVSLEFNQK